MPGEDETEWMLARHITYNMFMRELFARRFTKENREHIPDHALEEHAFAALDSARDDRDLREIGILDRRSGQGNSRVYIDNLMYKKYREIEGHDIFDVQREGHHLVSVSSLVRLSFEKACIRLSGRWKKCIYRGILRF